jgi:hypothetical protein
MALAMRASKWLTMFIFARTALEKVAGAIG